MKNQKWESLQEEIKFEIITNIKCIETREAFLDYYVNSYVFPIINDRNVYEREYLGWKYLISVFNNKSIEDLNWNFICEVYNFDLLNTLYYCESLNANQDSLINKAYKEKEKRKNVLGAKNFYKVICEFFKYLAYSPLYCDRMNVLEIKNYLHLLTEIKKSKVKRSIPLYAQEVLSNYPPCCHYNNLIPIKHANETGDEETQSNFHVRTDSKFVKDILYSYLLTFNSDQLYGRHLRVFMYYFNESLGDSNVKEQWRFDEKLFTKQYQYFKDLQDPLYGKLIVNSELKELLVQFYRYLVYSNKKLSNFVLLPTSFKEAILSKSFYRYFEQGYNFVYYNPLEGLPVCNKFCIIPNNYSFNSAHNSNQSWIGVDLEDVSLKFQEDIKEFIWNSNSNIKTNTQYLYKIKQFLNLWEEFNKAVFPFKRYEGNKIFSSEFLWEYRSQEELEANTGTSLKGVLKGIRKFLIFYKERYKVTDSDLKILNLKGLEVKTGGQPLTQNDSNKIYKEFENLSNIRTNGELYTIVFEIFILTNLRIGEILNLRRECIVNEYSDGTGDISYVSKNSNKEYVTQRVSSNIINLIKKAIRITQPVVQPNRIISNYIFIEEYHSSRIKHNKRINFSKYFSNIIEKLRPTLEVKEGYHPYNVRHTFIDNAYKEGIKKNLSINEIALITGNSYKTANQYYRKHNDIEFYVEAMAKVTFSDVDIKGNILLEETKQMQNLVKENLGHCGSDTCIFEIGECLLCRHFVTFVNRIPNFENLIQKYNSDIENTNNYLEIEELNIQKKLLGKYLSEMYKIKLVRG
ncbi:tyrosine-type recombinase/integrase [Priestia sp. TGN 0903]|uniref:tyrosine-type recombinase/integrase n=1 Tax=Priestia sp. TGN 0903 TaxID=3420730 RepID=UPI003D76EB8A